MESFWKTCCCTASAVTLATAGCSSSDAPAPPGVRVDLVIVESSHAAPADIDGHCVVFLYRLADDDAAQYQNDPAVSAFRHLGRSVLDCMNGTAYPYLGEAPEGYFDARLWINLDGVCPDGFVGCYWPDNPTIDRAQAFVTDRPPDFEAELLGHEIWHAVAGDFHT